MQVVERCKCEKTAVYDLLRTVMVGGPVQVFTRYYEKDITRIRSHVYEEKRKFTRGIIVYGANSSFVYSSGNVMLCSKDRLVVNKKPFHKIRIVKFSKDVLKGKVIGFAQVDIEVPDKLYDKFRRCHHCLLFKRLLIVIYLKK